MMEIKKKAQNKHLIENNGKLLQMTSMMPCAQRAWDQGGAGRMFNELASLYLVTGQWVHDRIASYLLIIQYKTKNLKEKSIFFLFSKSQSTQKIGSEFK